MEEGQLEYISNIILKHIHNTAYDETKEFKNFKLEIMINMKEFLSKDNYEKNKQIIKSDKIENSLEISQYGAYLVRLTREITISLLRLSQNAIQYSEGILEIMISIMNLLDPYRYDQNIKYLQQESIKQKKIDTLHGWC